MTTIKRAMDVAASRALTAPGYEAQPGYCQRWTRQVIESVHGDKYERYRGATADEAAHKWASSPYVVDQSRGTLPGDIYYWFADASQPEGHVAIRITGNRIAENSTVHRGGKHGARGTRPLSAKRPPDVVIRLPEPEPKAAKKGTK